MTNSKWDELSEHDHARLQGLAETFGITLPGGQMVLPSKNEARGIAIEMFAMSRAILNAGAE